MIESQTMELSKRALADACPFQDSNLSNYEASANTDDHDLILSSRCEDPGLYYDMTGDKILIIFNHYRYKKTRHYKIVPSTRDGTYQDVKSLEKTFRNRGFIVITHNDWKYKDIMKYLSFVSQKDHSQTSCLAVAVMTHGLGAHLCASDRLYPVADITEMIGTAPGLVGKPKLFLIQACRERHTSPPGGPHRVFTIPEGVDDCLVLYSTYEDYLSYRNCNGSWLMQALCEAVGTRRDLDFRTLAILVNKVVAAKTSGWGKQTPVTESNFTKILVL